MKQTIEETIRGLEATQERIDMLDAFGRGYVQYYLNLYKETTLFKDAIQTIKDLERDRNQLLTILERSIDGAYSRGDVTLMDVNQYRLINMRTPQKERDQMKGDIVDLLIEISTLAESDMEKGLIGIKLPEGEDFREGYRCALYDVIERSGIEE